MLQTRVIPVLLIHKNALVKTIKFKTPKYIGDPLNAIKIFNEKEVDELVVLDIDASKNLNQPNFEMIKSFASECFMPVCYGGGITTIDQMKKIFAIGIEKISINTSAINNKEIIRKACKIFGSQSIVVTIDVKKNIFGNYKLYNHSKKKCQNIDPIIYMKEVIELGVGEILINSVDRDGTQNGYDIDLLRNFRSACTVPIIACGGAGCLNDLKRAKETANISAVAAGSLFVYHGKHNAVLINYPKYDLLEKLFE